MSEPAAAAPARFPRVFWTANLTELCERAAFYSIASFVVIYLEELGFGKYFSDHRSRASEAVGSYRDRSFRRFWTTCVTRSTAGSRPTRAVLMVRS